VATGWVAVPLAWTVLVSIVCFRLTKRFVSGLLLSLTIACAPVYALFASEPWVCEALGWHLLPTLPLANGKKRRVRCAFVHVSGRLGASWAELPGGRFGNKSFSWRLLRSFAASWVP
jgi:hypothetical protein